MSTTKKKPLPSPTDTNGTTGDVFTLAEAASYLRVSEAALLDLVRSQNLPGRSVGEDWRFLKSAIQQWLCTGAQSAQSRKEAQLALAGKYKDDPDLMRICEEAYKQRGHPMAEAE